MYAVYKSYGNPIGIGKLVHKLINLHRMGGVNCRGLDFPINGTHLQYSKGLVRKRSKCYNEHKSRRQFFALVRNRWDPGSAHPQFAPPPAWILRGRIMSSIRCGLRKVADPRFFPQICLDFNCTGPFFCSCRDLLGIYERLSQSAHKY